MPSGDATAGDVVTGKTFYGDDRTEVTGTLVVPEAVDYSSEGIQKWPNGLQEFYDPGEFYYCKGASSVWTNTLPDNGDNEVWKDELTGLYWSNALAAGYLDNDYSITSCDYFGSEELSEEEQEIIKSNYNGGNVSCGEAINACAELELDSDGDSVTETDWYLPTQKEALRAYLDAITCNTGDTFVGEYDGYIWTSTEGLRNWNYAFAGDITYGIIDTEAKTYTEYVRCVRRD